MSETRLSRRDLVAAAAVVPLVATAAATPAHATMRDALSHLQLALTALQNASAGKGGHRAEAIRLTKAAISQVQQGIAFAQ
jgi:hypothetical protein